MIKIKICGLFRPQDAEYANEALPDFIGFVFAQSSRQVCYKQAEQIRRILDKRIHAVGVFVNAQTDEIMALVRGGIIDAIQLHGDENMTYLETLKSKTSLPITKALRVQNSAQILEAQNLPCDFLLLDTYQKGGYGGSGNPFDWALIPELKKPFFIAGGITLANIRKALKLSPYCVDISSGAETDGRKDREKMVELVKIIRGYGQ